MLLNKLHMVMCFLFLVPKIHEQYFLSPDLPIHSKIIRVDVNLHQLLSPNGVSVLLSYANYL